MKFPKFLSLLGKTKYCPRCGDPLSYSEELGIRYYKCTRLGCNYELDEKVEEE